MLTAAQSAESPRTFIHYIGCVFPSRAVESECLITVLSQLIEADFHKYLPPAILSFVLTAVSSTKDQSLALLENIGLLKLMTQLISFEQNTSI